MAGLRSKSQILYGAFVLKNIIINDGILNIETSDGSGINSETEINGGNVSIKTEDSYCAFKYVPSINPKVDWEILYSNKNEAEKVKADITDIYNIYSNPIIEISRKFVTGDINGDGKVNITDVALVNSHVKKIKILKDYRLKRADINCDGKVNITDVALINSHVKKIKLLTEEEFSRADINNDRKINGKDWNRLYEHINETNLLF